LGATIIKWKRILFKGVQRGTSPCVRPKIDSIFKRIKAGDHKALPYISKLGGAFGGGNILKNDNIFNIIFM